MNQSNNGEKDGFVRSPFFEEMIERTIAYLQAGYPVHFCWAIGVGKTSLALYIASQLNKPVSVIRGHHELSNKDLLGFHLESRRKKL